MNPHTVGDGNGADARPSHDTEAATLARIPAANASLPVRHRGAASTDLVLAHPAPTEPGEPGDGSARSGTVVTGALRLDVNAPDGSVVADCPPSLRPEVVPAPVDPAVRPRSTSGLLERDALCERLRGMLLEGRSVRLVGSSGSGRSVVLDAVATACSGLAPAGVVRLTGYARTSADLLQDLFAATHHAPGYRPGRALIPALLRNLCAVVVIDDVEFSGDALEDLLAAAPESAFLLTSDPATATAPPLGSRLEDTRLPGLSRQSSLALLARLAGRSLDETERAWAVDLWFESEGLPLRFVQAAALLRHREAAIEAMAAGLPGPEWLGPASSDTGVELLAPAEADRPQPPGSGSSPRSELELTRQPTQGGFDAYLSQRGQDDEPIPDPVPLPSVAESAAPAVRISRGLSTAARRTLRLATALGGECPSAPHLPALIDVGQGEEALAELVEAGLAAPVGGHHHRLVQGVTARLAQEWPDEDAAREAAQHFTWWTGHASVTEAQIAAEAEVLLAAMHADREAGRHQQVVLLARATAPAFALALRWGAWERALRFGLESARATAAVAEEAWFHHELGVLALCVGAHDRARAELEASVALRGALGDSRGTASGKRALRQLDAGGSLLAGRTVLLGGRAPSGGPGLRRVLPFRRTGAPEQPATGRQILLAVAGVVSMGVLGAAVALGLGAFEKAGASTGPTVGPAVTEPLEAPTGAAPGSTDSSGGGSASPPASTAASASSTPSAGQQPGQGQPTTPGSTPSSPGLTPSAPGTVPTGRPTTIKPTTPAPPITTPPSTAPPTTAPPTTPPPTSGPSTPSGTSSTG
jgi:hypothetical protein